MKRFNWGIFLCLRYSQVFKGKYSREIYLTRDVMLKFVLMLLVNPLMVFSGLYIYSHLNKAKHIESNKDEIKRHQVTSLMHFYVIY